MPPIQPLQAEPDEIVPVKPRDGIDVVVNGRRYRHHGDPAMPLLWYLRDVLQLTGAKYACDDGTCGACTVLVNGKAAFACTQVMRDLAEADILTVEGLAHPDGTLDPLQQAFVDRDAIGCGYCVPGQIMAAKALLARKAKITDQDIDGIDNLCRCGRYPSIRDAIKQAAAAREDHA